MRVFKVSAFAVCMLTCAVSLAQQPPTTAQTTATGAVIRASDLSGLVVDNPKDERLGKIEDLVLDPATGRIRYAVLSFGGVLGIGDKYFALPWHSLTFVPKGQTSVGTQKESHCVVDVDKEFLKNAPGFDKDHWPDFADHTWQQKVDEYYRTRAAAHGQNQTR